MTFLPHPRDKFLATAISEKLAGNAACGVGDPYPHDVAAATAVQAYYALGGTEDDLKAAWRVAYGATPEIEGGGLAVRAQAGTPSWVYANANTTPEASPESAPDFSRSRSGEGLAG